MRNLIKRNPLLPITLNENFVSRRESFCVFIIMRWWRILFALHARHLEIFHISVIIKSSLVQKLMQTENGKYTKWTCHSNIGFPSCFAENIWYPARRWRLLKFSEPQHLSAAKDPDSITAAVATNIINSNNGKYAKHHPPNVCLVWSGRIKKINIMNIQWVSADVFRVHEKKNVYIIMWCRILQEHKHNTA